MYTMYAGAERRVALHDAAGAVSYPPYDAEPPLTRAMGAFLRLVRTGTADPDQLAAGTAVGRAIAAAEESVARGGARVAIVH